MSITHISTSKACVSVRAGEGALARLAGRVAEWNRERRRSQTLRQLLALHDGLLDDLGVSRSELASATRPRLPADVSAWIGSAR